MYRVKSVVRDNEYARDDEMKKDKWRIAKK